ncbi:hypothetical protein [Lacicoccus qingdaonensis]|uniref:Phage gp6-like head-tail connector protein n=1 Tax=Lacicoccus qingdaonensis TaxID=576118 RepID=A0A1G9F243_9BACL|nr:hypothetical protein [Salinicoccus qingdaonensis]SDK82486.1 hypothetical protein SAMN05216216_11089 [Salinicoccus qingdaonensis]
MEITDDVVQEFKGRMRVYHNHEDDRIESMLEGSYAFLTNKCGHFSMDEPNQGKELVFERTRYVYHDAVEYFDVNYKSMVMNFMLRNLEELKPDDEAVDGTL